MANIVLKTFAAGDEGQGTVTPQDDSLIYQNAVSVNGIFGGATVTLTGANTLHIASGFGIICGRFFEINESDISVQLSSSGTLSGRLKIHLDLNNADNPIEIVTETGATLPALSGDSNININGGAFDMELCTFSVNELTISSLVNTFPTIDSTSKQVRRKTAYSVNDFALCQNASDALIFICTTAGTTAVQQPTGYTTTTDGNTITDGTAVFKAVSVSGQITQISKIGNLSNLNTTEKSSTVAAINEVDAHADNAQTTVNNAQQMIAPILSSLVAPSGGLASGDQFIYQGLLYKATAAIAQGGTITINGNCALADSVTAQLAELEYSNSSIALNHWTITEGDWYVYRKGKVVTICVDLGFLQPLAATTEYDMRILPDWARPSRTLTFTREMIDKNVNVAFNILGDGYIKLFGYQQIAMQSYHFYDTWTYIID